MTLQDLEANLILYHLAEVNRVICLQKRKMLFTFNQISEMEIEAKEWRRMVFCKGLEGQGG